MPKEIDYKFELDIERRLRSRGFLLPIITIFMAALIYVSLIYFGKLFNEGHYWIVLFSGMFGHAFFIVLIHDAAHKSVTRTSFDRILLNIGSGMMLLPFYGEFFRKYHLIHHSIPNTEFDPLWPPEKKKLYTNHRFFYLLFALVPLLYTIYLVFKSDKNRQSKNQNTSNSLKVNFVYILGAFLLSLLIVLLLQPNWVFCLLTVVTMSWFSTIRHWCEHIGFVNDKESNTFWFPMGMGIGNHDTHHVYPHISWLSLFIGLWRRPKTTSIFKAIYGVCFNRNFIHYESSTIQSQLDD